MKKKLFLSMFLLLLSGVSLLTPIAFAGPLNEPFETGPYAIGYSSFSVVDPSGRLDSFGNPDTRVKAIISLDGTASTVNILTGETQEFLTYDELAAIKIPTIIIGQHHMVSFLKRHLQGAERYNRYLNNGYAVSNGLAVGFYK